MAGLVRHLFDKGTGVLHGVLVWAGSDAVYPTRENGIGGGIEGWDETEI